VALAALAAVGGSGCAAELTPDPRDLIGPLPSDPPPVPAATPPSPEAIALGRLLFWDPILSGDRDVACATCHHPDHGYSDGLDVSVGVGGRGIGPARAAAASPMARRTPRNSQTVLLTAWNGLTRTADARPELAPMFWDHRAASLEAQALAPIRSDVEMRGARYTEDQILAEIVARLAESAEYRARFAAAFGPGPIDASRLARALAAFQRTLIPGPSSVDRYLAGDDDALTPAAVRGLRGFFAAGCARCHSGPMFSDFQLHELPVPPRPGDPIDDGDGRFRFRTPSLRMVAQTGPYMHNGALATLADVLAFYDDLPAITDPLLAGVEPPIGGGDTDLLVLLQALSDGDFDRSTPERVPSGLPPGGPGAP
jgi:cytochrome c peroxidase